MMAQLLQKTAPPAAQQEVDELAHIPADDYIPKGQVEKLVQRAEKRVEKRTEEAVKKVLQEREQALFMDKLKSKFSDFDDVVNPETLEMLEQQDPELANSIAKMSDQYTIGLQAYKFIKSMGLAEKAPDARRKKEVDKKIEQNAKTIQTPQAYDKRPMAQTFQLTEAMKQDLYKEMMGCAKLAG